jgi:hypothetical protein
VVGVAGDVGDEAVGADEDLLGLGGDVDGLDDGEGLEVNDGDFGGFGEAEDEVAAIVGGCAAVTGAGEIDPLFELSRGGVDDGEAGLIPVGGEEESVVVGEGDALDSYRSAGFAAEGDDGDGFAGVEVEDGDAAGSDVGGVGEAAVAGESEHVRLGGAGGNFVEDLEGFGIDGGDGLIEFGGDVEDVAVGVVNGEMGAHAMAEVDDAGDLAGGNVDDEHLVAVSAGATDACVAVDGEVGGAAVGRGGDFVSGDAVFLEGVSLFRGGGVDEGEGVVFLIGDEEGAGGLGVGGGERYGEREAEQGADGGKNLHRWRVYMVGQCAWKWMTMVGGWCLMLSSIAANISPRLSPGRLDYIAIISTD